MRYQEIVQLMEIADTVKKKVTDRFKQEQPTLTDAQINYYLDRWDRFAPTFDPQLRDITRLSFSQVERLIDDAQTRVQLKGRDKVKNTGRPQDNLANEDDLIYDRNGLTILLGDLREKCIRYGQGYSWCISRQDASNMFYNYRFGDDHDQPVFYFVFDTDRPKIDPWHAVVIYVDAKGVYHVATADNPGDVRMTWEKIVVEQPKLARLKHLFQPQPLEDEERAEHAKYGQPVDTKTYAAWSLAEKYKYIQFGNNLSDEQLAATPRELISAYAKLNSTGVPDKILQMLSPSDQRVVERNRIEAAKQDYDVVSRIIEGGGTPSEAVQIAAATESSYVIKVLIDHEIVPSEAVQLAAVSNEPYGLDYLLDAGIQPSETVLLAAVRENPYGLKHILDAGIKPSVEMQLAAIKVANNPYTVLKDLLNAGIDVTPKVENAVDEQYKINKSKKNKRP